MLERALALANRWTLDHVAADWVDYVVSNTMTDFNRWANGFLWTYELKAQVVAVVDESPGVKTFVLRPNQHWHDFKPGQHVEVSLPIEGEVVRRHYSASPASRGRFSITVKRQDQGRASRWMHEHLRPGMALKLSHAQGSFYLDGQSQAKVLYLCAGSGITPCHSMVTALLDKPAAERPDIQVMAQFRQASEVIFQSALQRWSESGVKVTTALSAEAGGLSALPGHVVTRLDAASLLQHCPDLRERDIYLCGPGGFMAGMIDALQALGVDMKRVRTERFVPVTPSAQATPHFEADGAEVYFQHMDKLITLTPLDQGKTLLQLATDHGLALESGCGQGMCGTCKLRVNEGQVSGNVLGQVAYLCSSYPASTRVVLDA